MKTTTEQPPTKCIYIVDIQRRTHYYDPMTQRELAKRLKTTQGNVSRWLNGKVRPEGQYRETFIEKMPELYEKLKAKYPDLYNR